MEQPDVEKSCPGSDDVGLVRNRSFKSKQLVRSQAIREAASPPRTASPASPSSPSSPASDEGVNRDSGTSLDLAAACSDRTENVSDTSSHSDKCSAVNDKKTCDERKKQVEIQITSGSCSWEESSGQRVRTRRWLGHRPHSDSSRDLLTNGPRLTCVCGTCACPHCSGRRTKQVCPTKQDSGIVCSEDCPDCEDCSEHAGQNGDGTKTSGSFDAEEHVFYCRCPERKEKPKSLSITRTDSEDKMEPTGPELVNFIKETLNKNPRDRSTLLKIEKDLHALINDNGRCIVRFPVMTSYGRMLVHRCAALFQLAHHLDHTNKNSVLVSKSGTSGGRVPCTSFRQWCTAVFPRSPPRRHDDTLAKSILKREGSGSNGNGAGAAPRSKSLEQRERDYERVRRRIFSSDNCTQDENQWPWLNSGPVKLLTPEGGRNKLLKVQSLESRGCEGAGAGAGPARGPVSKSHSFGGYTAPPADHHRLLSRQGDLASSSWRGSAGSSGYKTLSVRSASASPSPAASPEPALVWAVTDLSNVPAGALVIHPQTGRPLTNPDGSLYHFDPQNPPALCDAALQGDIKVDSNGDKRRGKLEKQHSFIDNECDCGDEYRNTKCYCECRREPRRSDKTSKDVQTNSIPSSPIKNRYNKPPTPDQKTDKPYENNNHRQTYEQNNKYDSPKHTHIQYNNNSNSPKNFEPGNQKVYEATNQRSFESNQRPYEANHRPFENQRSFEVSNPKQYEANQRSFDNQRQFEANQRPSFENQRSFDGAQQFDRSKAQECQDVQSCYVQGMRSEEIISPLASGYGQEEASLKSALPTGVPGAEHMRPMSLSNMSYPLVQQPYQYVNQGMRIDQQMQAPAMYHQMQPEEQKMTHDNTFRIDPSYPYAADFAACGACEPQQQRGYNLQYGQVEMSQVPQMQAYQLPNVMLQQPLHYQQYQEAVQWAGLQPPLPASPAPKLTYDVYPLLYPNVYQPYNILYPQVIPQPYPMCQPVYPVLEKAPTPARQPPARVTPTGTPATTTDGRDDISAKIQQIKEQMAAVSTGRGRGRDDARRNCGSGLLGSHPAALDARPLGRGAGEEAQLSSAARAIVNSIRNMQAKNYPERRFNEPRDRERRPRTDRAPPPACGPPERRRPYNPLLQYRPPYLFRQMSGDAWCRRSPGPVTPVVNQPRRPHPDSRNGRR